MENKKNVLIMVLCSDSVKEILINKLADPYTFIFADSAELVTEEQLQDAHIIIGEPDKKQLLCAEKLKWLQMTWAGADRYTQMEDFPEDVILTNASGAFGTIIAEYVVGAIIAQYRTFPFYWKRQQEHIWEENLQEETVINKTVLILGTGDVGNQVAKRLKAFGTYNIGLNRSGQKKEEHAAFDEVQCIRQLDSCLPLADIVVCCLPGTKETIHLMNRNRLERMKKTALLVNVGRGNFICREELEDVLASGHLKGAILDVMDVEPLPKKSRLWDMKNVMITPHVAGPTFGGDAYTTECIWNICIENLKRYAKGENLHHVVDFKAGY